MEAFARFSPETQIRGGHWTRAVITASPITASIPDGSLQPELYPRLPKDLVGVVGLDQAFVNGEINKRIAKMLIKMVRKNATAAITLVTNQILIMLEKIANAALKIILDVVNTALGIAVL